jgi:PIN domain nuclease of toxin-antitoxin system
MLDTHTLIWHLQGTGRLSPKVGSILSQVDSGRAVAIISTIVVVEMIYLAEKQRIDSNLVDSVIRLLGTNSENYRLAPLDLSITQSLRRISRSTVADMPDRIVTATALALGVPLLSRASAMMRVPEIQTIW